MKIDRARMFDLRVVQRNIRSGRITKDEYGGWLTALSDASDNIQAAGEGGDDDGYDPTPPEEHAVASAPEPVHAPAPAAAPAPAMPSIDPANDPQPLG